MGIKDIIEKGKIQAKFNASLNQMSLTGSKINYKFKKYPVAGAVAEIDTIDAPAPQTTLTRIAAGAVIAGPVGAIVGGMLKKDRSQGTLIVTLPDGSILINDFPAAKATEARKFVALVNEAADFFKEA